MSVVRQRLAAATPLLSISAASRDSLSLTPALSSSLAMSRNTAAASSSNAGASTGKKAQRVRAASVPEFFDELWMCVPAPPAEPEDYEQWVAVFCRTAVRGVGAVATSVLTPQQQIAAAEDFDPELLEAQVERAIQEVGDHFDFSVPYSIPGYGPVFLRTLDRLARESRKRTRSGGVAALSRRLDDSEAGLRTTSRGRLTTQSHRLPRVTLTVRPPLPEATTDAPEEEDDDDESTDEDESQPPSRKKARTASSGAKAKGKGAARESRASAPVKRQRRRGDTDIPPQVSKDGSVPRERNLDSVVSSPCDFFSLCC